MSTSPNCRITLSPSGCPKSSLILLKSSMSTRMQERERPIRRAISTFRVRSSENSLRFGTPFRSSRRESSRSSRFVSDSGWYREPYRRSGLACSTSSPGEMSAGSTTSTPQDRNFSARRRAFIPPTRMMGTPRAPLRSRNRRMTSNSSAVSPCSPSRMPDKRLTESPESKSLDQEKVSSTRYPSSARNRATLRSTGHKGLAMITSFPTLVPARPRKPPIFFYYEEYFDGREIFWLRPGPSRRFFSTLAAPVEHFRVLQGHGGDVRKRGQQVQVLLGEGVRAVVVEVQDADDLVPPLDRDRQFRPYVRVRLHVPGILPHIPDERGLPLLGHPSRDPLPDLQEDLLLDSRPQAPFGLDAQHARPPVDEDHGAAGGPHQVRGMVDDELEEACRIPLLVQRPADLEDRRELLRLPVEAGDQVGVLDRHPRKVRHHGKELQVGLVKFPPVEGRGRGQHADDAGRPPDGSGKKSPDVKPPQEAQELPIGPRPHLGDEHPLAARKDLGKDVVVDLLAVLLEPPPPRDSRHRPDGEHLLPRLLEEDNHPLHAQDGGGGGGDQVEAVLDVARRRVHRLGDFEEAGGQRPRERHSPGGLREILPEGRLAEKGGDRHFPPSSFRPAAFSSLVSWDFTM